MQRSTYTRMTGSELLFNTLRELIESSRQRNERLFGIELLSRLEYFLENRPLSMALMNNLRNIALYYIEKGLDGIDIYIENLLRKYDEALWRAAEIASRRVIDGDVLLTNSNSIAIRRFFKTIRDQGKEIEVYVSESRPGSEGLLLAEYLENLGFTTNLIVDSASRFFMKNIDKVFLGAEAIAANGAVVSKIGSSLISLVAKEARKRVFIIAPSHKISYETIYGELFRVPEGDVELIVSREEAEKLPGGFRARAPLYDVTPAEYIDGIITEYGLIAPQAIPLLVRIVYGSYPPVTQSIRDIVIGVKNRVGREA